MFGCALFVAGPLFGFANRNDMRVATGVISLLAGCCGIIAIAIWVDLTPDGKCEKMSNGSVGTIWTCYWSFVVFLVGFAFSVFHGVGILTYKIDSEG